MNLRDEIAVLIDNELSGFGSYNVALGLANRILEMTRDSDAAAIAVDCVDNPVPQDRQARAESIAQKDAR